MTATIFRFDPATDAQPHYDRFELAIKAEDCMTVMDLLTHIADHLDGSLSFFSHSACLHGICGRCGIKCNGKPGLACETVLTGEDVTIEPMKKDVVKDLVVRN